MAAEGISSRAWGSIEESDYPTAEEFCAASLIDLNPKDRAKVKALCKLPVREPKSMGGRLNRNGVHAAAQRLTQTDAPVKALRKAAEQLVRLYGHLGQEPPESVRDLAR